MAELNVRELYYFIVAWSVLNLSNEHLLKDNCSVVDFLKW